MELTKAHDVEAPARNGHQKTRVVAICGTAGSSRHEIEQQPPEVELWGLNKSYKWMTRWDRWFDLHEHASYRDPEHIETLKAMECPVYMREQYGNIPNSVRYPLDAVLEGGRYQKLFTSMIAYMMALAIRENVSEIRLLGVDMATTSEWAYQRDACLYWRGVAEAKGIKVYLPEVSPLARTFLYGYSDPLMDGKRHALDWQDHINVQMSNEIDALVSDLKKRIFDFQTGRFACLGAMDLANKMVQGVQAEKPKEEKAEETVQ